MTRIAYAAPQEREEVAQFMDTVFPRAKWDIDGWRRLVAGRWNGPDGRYAVTVRADGRLVGVLGLVCVTRQTAKGPRDFVNMTSWYVLAEHRGEGVGQRMLDFITQDPDGVVTNFTSAKGAVSVLMRAGFRVLDEAQLVWQTGHDAAGLRLIDQPAVSERFSAPTRQLITDHAGLRVQPFGIETPEGPLLLMLYPQKKHDAYVTYETVHVSDPEIFAQYAQAIAGAVLPADAILTLDRRFERAGIQPDAVETLPTPRYAHAATTDPADIDLLYSECLLLNMKF